jgi:quinol monooxygenase YgiN
MFVIANQITPAPGKAGEFRKAAAQATEIAKAHGERLIAGFQVAMGQDVGSLVYFSAYEDGAAYQAAMKAVGESSDGNAVGPLIASTTSLVLQPLPDSPLQ